MAGLFFKLKQVVGVSNKTVDPTFEEARKVLTTINTRSEVLCKQMEKQQGAIADFINSLRTMCDAGVAAGAERVSATVAGPSSRSVERIKILFQEFRAWHVRVHACKEKIKERDTSLQDCDRFTEIINGIPPVGATPEHAAKRQVTETKLSAAKQQYDTVNAWLLDEISALDQANKTEIEPKVMEVFNLYSTLFASLSQAFSPYGGQMQATPSMGSSAFAASSYSASSYSPSSSPPVQMVSSHPPLPQKPKALPMPGAQHQTSPRSVGEAPPPLPPKSHRAPPPLPGQQQQQQPQDFEGQVGAAAGNAMASVATNPEVQAAVGNAAAAAASNEENQRMMGDAIASHTDNPFLRSMATNSAVQRSMGRAVGSAATNKAVQQRAGSFVATQAQDPENQRRMTSGIKSGFSAAASSVKNNY